MRRTAKIFRNGRSQAVRLPSEFRFKEKRSLSVRILKPETSSFHAAPIPGKVSLNSQQRQGSQTTLWQRGTNLRIKSESYSNGYLLDTNNVSSVIKGNIRRSPAAHASSHGPCVCIQHY
jgi:virulence-associated protein VagC